MRVTREARFPNQSVAYLFEENSKRRSDVVPLCITTRHIRTKDQIQSRSEWETVNPVVDQNR